MTGSQLFPRAACGAPGHLPNWGCDLDVWAQVQIARFDEGELSPWHVSNCLRVTPPFFDVHGRVLFGAASADEIDYWLCPQSSATSVPARALMC